MRVGVGVRVAGGVRVRVGVRLGHRVSVGRVVGPAWVLVNSRAGLGVSGVGLGGTGVSVSARLAVAEGSAVVDGAGEEVGLLVMTTRLPACLE